MSKRKICFMRSTALLPFIFIFVLIGYPQNGQLTAQGITASNLADTSAKAKNFGLIDSSKYIADRIRKVENGLLPSSIIVGQPIPYMKLTDRMNYHQTAGVSIAVINNYKIEWVKHYGLMDKEQQRVVNDQTIFQAGSISKPVTASMILKLIQHKKLDLDKNINTYLKSWKVPENEFTKDSSVTIRKILNHTAGFANTDLSGFHPDSAAPSLLQVLNGEPPAHTPPVRVSYIPGTKSEYTGSGFIILQQLLVDMFQIPFTEIMEKNIFFPLKMTSSTFENPIRKNNLYQNAAAGYQRGVKFDSKNFAKPMQASGGLWSNVHDLALWAVEIQKSLLGHSNKILKKDIIQLMLQPSTNKVNDFGLGFRVNRQDTYLRFGHGGYTDGFRSDLICFSSGQGLVVLTNGNSQAIIREITKAVAVEYKWPETEYYPIQRKLVQVSTDLLRQYIGEYEFPEGRNPRISKVELKEGKLYLDSIELFPESENHFFGLGESTLIFKKDTSGQVVELTLDYRDFKATAKKIK